MQVKDFELLEIQNFVVDLFQLVVGQVDPLQVVVVPHHISKNTVKVCNGPQLVVLQEK